MTKGILSDMSRAADGMTKGDTSVVSGKQKAIENSIASLNEQIERQESRIEKITKRLQRQFTELEMMMGRMQAQSDFIMQQIAQFNKDD